MKINKLTAIICILVMLLVVWDTWFLFFFSDDMKYMSPIISSFGTIFSSMFTFTGIKDLIYWFEKK